MSKNPPHPPVNYGPIFWPGTTIVKSMHNVFTAAERGDTQIDWANTPGFQLTEKQKASQRKAKQAGWGNGDMGPLSDNPRVIDVSPPSRNMSPFNQAAKKAVPA